MKRYLHSFLAAAALAAATVSAGTSAFAANYDDHDALQGAKEVRVAFDITAGDAKALLGRLNIIDETRQSLIQQGVTPHFVLSFRGPATKLVQSDISKIKPEEREKAIKIAAKLNEMREAKGLQKMDEWTMA